MPDESSHLHSVAFTVTLTVTFISTLTLPSKSLHRHLHNRRKVYIGIYIADGNIYCH